MKVKFAGVIAGVCVAGILLNGCAAKEGTAGISSSKNESVTMEVLF